MWFLILIHLPFLTKNCVSDIVLKHVANKGINVFKALPKHWNNYNIMMLYNCLGKSIKSNTELYYETTRIMMLQCSKTVFDT